MQQLMKLAVRMLREELQLLQEQGSYVGEVVKAMDKKKVLVKVIHTSLGEDISESHFRKLSYLSRSASILSLLTSTLNTLAILSSKQVHPEGKFVVDLDKNIDINDVTPNCRVALRNDSYTLHKILPNKVTHVGSAV